MRLRAGGDEVRHGTRPGPIPTNRSRPLFGPAREPERTRLTAPIFFNDLRAIAHLGHSSPDFPHGAENPRLLSRWHAWWRGDGTQLRHRLTAAFDDDNSAIRGLAHQFRSVDVELA